MPPLPADAAPASLPDAILAILEAFAPRPEVAAIALGGSRSVTRADDRSDYDVYVYGEGEIPEAVRREVAARLDPAPEIGNTWFGLEDAWEDRAAGVVIDLMSFDRRWFEDELRAVIERHRPSLGYSTAFWFTARRSLPLVDHDGWFARMQALAARPYPEPLRHAIIALNHPLLRTARFSYRHQVELALRRNDPVSVQHRITAFLASVFDIVFAANWALHPGEKRLLDHVAALGDGIPGELIPHVRDLLGGGEPLPALDAVCDDIDAMLPLHGVEIPSGN